MSTWTKQATVCMSFVILSDECLSCKINNNCVMSV